MNLSYKQLTLEDDVNDFDCGSEEWQREVSDFLKEDAFAQQEIGLNRTFLFFDDGQLVAYTTLVASSLRLEADPERLRGLEGLSEAIDDGRKAFPAVLIGQFGVTAALQRKGYGKYVLEWIVAHALNLEVGVRFLTLHVDRRNSQARGFWKQEGFRISTESGNSVLFLWYDLLGAGEADPSP